MGLVAARALAQDHLGNKKRILKCFLSDQGFLDQFPFVQLQTTNPSLENIVGHFYISVLRPLLKELEILTHMNGIKVTADDRCLVKL